MLEYFSHAYLVFHVWVAFCAFLVHISLPVSLEESLLTSLVSGAQLPAEVKRKHTVFRWGFSFPPPAEKHGSGNVAHFSSCCSCSSIPEHFPALLCLPFGISKGLPLFLSFEYSLFSPYPGISSLL